MRTLEEERQEQLMLFVGRLPAHLALIAEPLMRMYACKIGTYGLKPEFWGRVVPDPWAELQVDPARGPQVQGLDRLGSTSLCVASPEHANSHSPDASYHGEQGYNPLLKLNGWAISPQKA